MGSLAYLSKVTQCKIEPASNLHRRPLPRPHAFLATEQRRYLLSDQVNIRKEPQKVRLNSILKVPCLVCTNPKVNPEKCGF